MTHPDDDRLLSLVSGLVPGDAAEEFLAHVEGCGPCESRLRALSEERERLRSRAAEVLRHLPEPAPPATVPVTRGGLVPGRLKHFSWGAWRWGAVSVAAVAIVLIMVTGREPGSRHGHGLPWLPRFPDAGELVVTRNRESREPDTLLTQGLAAYARGDMKGASRLLGGVHAAGRVADLAQIYYGSALAWNGEWQEASKRLSEVHIDALPEPWRDDTRWTLQVAWRASGQTARADSLLEVIATAGRGALAERAKAERARLHGAHP